MGTGRPSAVASLVRRRHDETPHVPSLPVGARHAAPRRALTWHCRNLALRRSRGDPVMPHLSAPARCVDRRNRKRACASKHCPWGRGMPRRALTWHCRNLALRRSRGDPVMPHLSAPARCVDITSGSDDELHRVACIVKMTVSVVAVPTPPFPLVGEGGCSQEQMFWQAPACHLPLQPSERPNSPFSPRGRRGQGG